MIVASRNRWNESSSMTGGDGERGGGDGKLVLGCEGEEKKNERGRGDNSCPNPNPQIGNYVTTSFDHFDCLRD